MTKKVETPAVKPQLEEAKIKPELRQREKTWLD